MKSYVVIGLGLFGSSLARQLYAQGCEVLAIDSSSESVQQISEEVTQAVVADARDKGVLKALGVKDFDCGIVGIGDDLANSVLTVMNLKELGVPYVVCKAHDQTHKEVLRKLGADRVVIPEMENACRLAKSLASENVLDYIELSQDYGIIDVPAPASWAGKNLMELNVRARLGVNILAIKRGGGITVSPSADFSMKAGDVVVILGDNGALKAVQKLK